jgi:hypothetical protein
VDRLIVKVLGFSFLSVSFFLLSLKLSLLFLAELRLISLFSLLFGSRCCSLLLSLLLHLFFLLLISWRSCLLRCGRRLTRGTALVL